MYRYWQSRHARQSATVALLTLFSLQLLTIWIESIYRIGLIKTSMGNEIYGLLVILAPLLLILVPERWQLTALRVAVIALLAARLVVPMLGIRANLVVAAFGVSAAVVLIAFAFSNRYAIPRGSLGTGFCWGLLTSIALRAWGSSYDPTMGGNGTIVGWAFVMATAVLAGRLRVGTGDETSHTQMSGIARTILAIALFTNLSLVYWVLSSPAVLTAWTESSYLMNVVLLVSVWTLTAANLRHVEALPTAVLLVWNVAFVACLVGGILLHTPTVPMTVEQSPIVVWSPSLATQIPIHLMCLLSPVVLANILLIARQDLGDSPRTLALPMVIGLVVLTLLTVMAVFTNVWGYVGDLSAPLRGKFHLPFLISGGLMILPFLIHARHPEVKPAQDSARDTKIGIGLVVGLLAVLGVIAKSQRSGTPDLIDRRLTVLTYNLQLGSETDGNQNWFDQIELLRQIDADIIGLQESDAARPGGGNVDVARMYGDALGYYWYYGPNSIAGTFGTAILSRFPLEQTRTIYSFSTKDEAGTAVAEFQVDGRAVTIFNSHPAGKDQAKLAHIDDLISAAGSLESVIAVGDYNMRQTSPQYQRISGVLDDSWKSLYDDAVGRLHPTIGAQDAMVAKTIDMQDRIDHIFHSANFATVESYYLPAPQSETDHPAHWSILEWKLSENGQ